MHIVWQGMLCLYCKRACTFKRNVKKGKSVNFIGHNKILASPLLYYLKGDFRKKHKQKITQKYS